MKKIKILWLTNVILPIVADNIDEKKSVYGGWLDSLSKQFFINVNISFISVFPSHVTKHGKIKNNMYYEFNILSSHKSIEAMFCEILLREKPDIIHVFGTEFGHSLFMTRAAEKCNMLGRVIVNIQGLISVCAKHYLEGIPNDIRNRYTLRDFLRQDNLIQQQKKFVVRGQNEIKVLRKVSNVIGRTDFDKACTLQINPKLHYFFCNESLRDIFYKYEWKFSECHKHTIFISQASYVLKGFHWVVEAAKILKNEFPDIKIYVSGETNFTTNDIVSKVKRNSYQKYIRHLLYSYDLIDTFVFVGSLDDRRMCTQYLKTNVFVSASNLENSSNSVAEAMLLGVPIVASDVGGMNSIITHNVDGYLYPSTEPYMLAYYISILFKNETKAKTFSKNAQRHALQRHDKKQIEKDVYQIYKKILGL